MSPSRHQLYTYTVFTKREAPVKGLTLCRSIKPEVKYPFGIADGLYIVRLTLDGDCVMLFLEYDDGQNVFTKAQQYLAYYAGKSWRGEWWGQSFPLVLIVTPRAQEIRMLAKGEIFRVIGEGEKIMDAIMRRQEFVPS